MQATEAPTYEMIDPQTSGRLKESIAGHEGMAILEKAFGTGLKRAPLSRAALERFLACHVAFVRDVPTSILTVANRLSHACMKFDYFGGHSIAARTLFAAVHEYGLQNTEVGFAKTHFELYRDGIRSFGFDEKAILSNKSIFPEAVEMADWNVILAQNAPLAKALGATSRSRRPPIASFCFSGKDSVNIGRRTTSRASRTLRSVFTISTSFKKRSTPS